jgi:CYTH domain-containing protein
MTLCEPPVIVKTRYIVEHKGNRWEVDEFHDGLQGLVIAELEVPSEDYAFPLPDFVGKEVTGDPRYCNSQLGISK